MKAACMIALAVVGAVLVSACVQIKTSPSNESETMATERGTSLLYRYRLRTSARCTWSKATPVRAVEAASDIISSIRTEVTNGILTINAAHRSDDTANNLTHLVPTINQISNSGAGPLVAIPAEHKFIEPDLARRGYFRHSSQRDAAHDAAVRCGYGYLTWHGDQSHSD